MHDHDDKYPARPGFKPGTSRLQQVPVDTNEPQGSAPACVTSAEHQTFVPCRLLTGV